jgi:uncharacterized protein (DUF3820 family)
MVGPIPQVVAAVSLIVSPFGKFIVRVFLMRPAAQMLWVAAFGVVAGVHDNLGCRVASVYGMHGTVR